MKRRIFRIVVSFVALVIVVVSLTFTFAWYTNTNQVGKFDAETKNLAITYELDDKDVDVTTYSVTNLVFFDIDDPKELKFLNDMHTVIKLDIKNLSSDAINYSIIFESVMKITSTTTTEGETTTSTVTSKAYVAGFISNSPTISIEDNNTNSISTYLPANANTSADATTYKSVSTGEINVATESTLYLHILGVQEIDSASNEFLFDSEGNAVEYNFTITIEAVGKTIDPTEK